MKQNLIVIGNGMAGMRTVEELLKLNSNRYEITVIGAEPHGNYNRIMLSPVVSGEKNFRDILIHDRAWYQKKHINLIAGTSVTELNKKQKILKLENGKTVDYDKLVIATGSNPFMLPIPGATGENVIAFRTINDVETMLEAAKCKRNAVVIGGGVLGLEAAYGLNKQGMNVTVIQRESYIMDRQLDGHAAKLLQNNLAKRGIHFLTNANTKDLVCDEENNAVAIRFDNKPELPVDLVIMAVGVQPNNKLGQDAGLDCGRGIVVNDGLQTSDPSIYAVGECIEHRGQTFGLVVPLYDQAKILAQHLAGDTRSQYRPVATTTSLKVSGVHLFSAGEFTGDSDCETILYQDKALNIYKKLVVRENMLIGALCYGDITDSQWYTELIQSGQRIDDLRENLVFGRAYTDAA